MALRATLGHESRAAKDTGFRFLYVTFNGAKRSTAESKDLHFHRVILWPTSAKPRSRPCSNRRLVPLFHSDPAA
jgi:hypothetical protein